MTNDTRSPEEIEREIERERAGLSDTLNDLQDRFSVETVARQVTDQFREHGGDIGRSVSDAVKRNPIALGLTGAGLAWLMLGNRSHDDDRRYDDYRRYRDREVRDRSHGYGADDRPDRAPVTAYRSRPDRPLYSGRYGSAHTAPGWARTRHEEDSAGTAQQLRETASNVGDKVSGAASDISDSARDAGSTVADKARGAAAAAKDAGASAVEKTQDLGSAAAQHAADLRDRLAEGTQDLTAEARHRVVVARQRAIEAREAAADYARQGRERAVDIFEEQPLVAGALAVAIGAALGAALPRSRVEDEYLGEQSDRLIDEAERIFAEEKEKLGKVAKAIKDEAGEAASDLRKEADAAASGSTVAQTAAEKAKSAGKRIADAAQSEAEKQDLGDIGKPPKSST